MKSLLHVLAQVLVVALWFWVAFLAWTANAPAGDVETRGRALAQAEAGETTALPTR